MFNRACSAAFLDRYPLHFSTAPYSWYWSRGLGHFRAFVTDLKRVVVLRFERRTVVVSPDQPEGFVRAIDARCRDSAA